jgi:hypothetical protein
VQHKDAAIAHRLLAACADVLAVDSNRQTALHHAARTGADVGCLGALLDRAPGGTAPGGTAPGDADHAVLMCELLDVWGRTALHWAVVNGHREAIVALVEAGSDISLRDLQNDSSIDLAEKRAECQAVSPTGKCDRLTVNLLRLMLPPDHADYSSFHPEGFMDLCTYEVLQHAARLGMNADEREALLAMSPEERAAIGDHLMTIDELNARTAQQQAMVDAGHVARDRDSSAPRS